MSLFPFPSAQNRLNPVLLEEPRSFHSRTAGAAVLWGTLEPRPLWTEEKFPTLSFAPSGRLQELTESLQTLLFHGDDCGPDRDWEEVSHGLEKILPREMSTRSPRRRTRRCSGLSAPGFLAGEVGRVDGAKVRFDVAQIKTSALPPLISTERRAGCSPLTAPTTPTPPNLPPYLTLLI